MKFLAIILLVSSLSVQAQNLRSLKDVMADLGTSFKAVTIGLQAGSITPQMITDSEKMLTFIIESESLIPDTILALPNIEQDAAKIKYNQEMKDLEAKAQEFSTALKENNVDLAKKLLLDLGLIKKQGHKDYK